MNQTKLVIGVLAGTVVVLLGVGVLMARMEGKVAGAADVEGVAGEARLATGRATPKVTIVEWSDFQCPACKQAQYLVKEILGQYPDDVRLVYRHFPLVQIHKNALAAAELAEAAAAAGKFWQMHDLLFERQSEWAEDKDKLAEYRQELGIELGGSYKDKVEADMWEGQALGINATPTFFVNGKKIDVVKLKAVIEEELRSAQDGG